jgi:hypothetical protein
MPQGNAEAEARIRRLLAPVVEEDPDFFAGSAQAFQWLRGFHDPQGTTPVADALLNALARLRRDIASDEGEGALTVPAEGWQWGRTQAVRKRQARRVIVVATLVFVENYRGAPFLDWPWAVRIKDSVAYQEFASRDPTSRVVTRSGDGFDGRGVARARLLLTAWPSAMEQVEAMVKRALQLLVEEPVVGTGTPTTAIPPDLRAAAEALVDRECSDVWDEYGSLDKALPVIQLRGHKISRSQLYERANRHRSRVS